MIRELQSTLGMDMLTTDPKSSIVEPIKDIKADLAVTVEATQDMIGAIKVDDDSVGELLCRVFLQAHSDTFSFYVNWIYY